MMMPVPKCLATKNKLAQKPAFLPKAIGSPLETLSPFDCLAQPEIMGIMTPKADETRTIKMEPT